MVTAFEEDFAAFASDCLDSAAFDECCASEMGGKSTPSARKANNGFFMVHPPKFERMPQWRHHKAVKFWVKREIPMLSI